MNPTYIQYLLEIIEEDPKRASAFATEYMVALTQENDTADFLRARLNRSLAPRHWSSYIKNKDFSLSNSKLLRTLASSNKYFIADFLRQPEAYCSLISELGDDKEKIRDFSNKTGILEFEFGINQIDFISPFVYEPKGLETAITRFPIKPPMYDKLYSDGTIEQINGFVIANPEKDMDGCMLSLARPSFILMTQKSFDGIHKSLERDKRYLTIFDLDFNVNKLNGLIDEEPTFGFIDDITDSFKDKRDCLSDDERLDYDLTEYTPSLAGQNPHVLYKSGK